MRYFVKTDKNEKPTRLYKFNVDEWKANKNAPIIEQVWADGEWIDTQTLSEFLVRGGTELAEVDAGQAGKLFPGAL